MTANNTADKDIFYDKYIYLNVKSPYPEKEYEVLWATQHERIEFIGSHNFTDGQPVFEGKDYELKQEPYQHAEDVEQEITIGKIITEAITLHELNPDVVEQELKFPEGIIVELMQDNIYTNSVPVVLFKNLLLSLHIPFAKIEPVMASTFKLLLSKETAESLKKKPQGYMLWENEESVIKYTKRLQEIMEPVNKTEGENK